MEIGYNSALPALLALESMKEDKVIGWDPRPAKATRFSQFRYAQPHYVY